MKTIITKLVTMLFTIAAITATTSSVFAQRRPNQNTKTENRVEKDEQRRSTTIREKSVFKEKDLQQHTPQNSRIENRREIPANSKEVNRKSGNPKVKERTSQRKVQAQTPQNSRSKLTNRNENVTKVPAHTSPTSDRYNTSVRRRSVRNTPANVRSGAKHNRSIYRIDERDSRYTPSRNFKGGNSYWSEKHAVYHIPYERREKNYYSRYDHRKYKHWDRNWETYRWNIYSWRDYYRGYHPYSYRFHKHYYHHTAFGHVIRKFHYRPVSFIHNNIRYYNYNGHFFRYFRGIGYVLVDMPYGIVFHELPVGYERVYVNGFLYFRIGNLFFEMNSNGYSLIHYPERYFAMETEFTNGGYYYPGN
jgi:hypothetical protein